MLWMDGGHAASYEFKKKKAQGAWAILEFQYSMQVGQVAIIGTELKKKKKKKKKQSRVDGGVADCVVVVGCEANLRGAQVKDNGAVPHTCPECGKDADYGLLLSDLTHIS